jgi:7-cyano-7-deazaguanine synthase
MTAPLSDERALVLFSGGQDSTICLAWALQRFPEVETVGFDYGQRHAVELECRAGLREALSKPGGLGEARLGPDHRLTVEALGRISETALTRPRAGCPPPSCPAET